MRFMKVEFTEWRDPVLIGRDTELSVASGRVAEAAQREATARIGIAEIRELRALADSQELLEQEEAAKVVLANLLKARRAAVTAEEAAGDAATVAMKSHARVGTIGYQVINEENEVVRLADRDGADLPAGAVYGYRIIDTDPAPLPQWALDEQAAQGVA
jgi:hypothetical protein